MIVLVRHAAPEVADDVPPSRWRLSAPGRAAALGLAPRLAALAGPHPLLCSSGECKARETVEPLARALGQEPASIVLDDRFGEVWRPPEPIDDAWREHRRRYVEGTVIPGWERLGDVGARFDAAVAEHAPVAGGTAVVIATHGMVLTSWLVARGLVAPEDAGAFWADLRLPDVLTVDLTRGSVARAEWAGATRSATGNGPRVPTR